MERNIFWRFLLVGGVLLLSAFYVAPTVIYLMAPPEVRRDKEEMARRVPKWLTDHRMNLGIDLQGGLHLVMGVDTDKAVLDRTDRVGDEIFESLKEKGKPPKSLTRVGDRPELKVVLGSSDDWSTFKELADERKGSWEVRSHDGDTVLFGIVKTFEISLRDDAVSQAQKTLRNRIDKYGVTEPEVRKRGNNSIQIQIAGLTADQERSVKDDIIGKTAQLEFKLVDDESTYFSDIAAKGLPDGVELKSSGFQGRDDAMVSDAYLEAKTKAELEAVIKANPPPADRVVRYQEVKRGEAPSVFRTWLLDRKTPLTGDALVNAFVAVDNDKNSYYVAMKFDQRGAVAFERLTRENVKRRMAIVLDDTVDSAPVIQGPIPNGNASITLGDSFKSQEEVLKDANSLALVLKAGALPAPVFVQEERTVGATLGEDAIQKGKAAFLATSVLIIGLMLFYYRLTGAIGLIALAANMLLLLAGLSAFRATLTLPGIAGLALTVGMAIDANIVQFERIREELLAGKTARAAVDLGFDRAFAAILDSNVTAFLSAVVLYQYGSGPIRGFATTLGLGVVINTVTAVVVPRLLFDYLTRVRRVQTLSI